MLFEAGLVKINLTEEGLKFFPGCAEKGHYVSLTGHPPSLKA